MPDRRLQLLVPSISVDSSVTHFQKASPFGTSYSSSSLIESEIHDDKPEDGKHQSFTVSYLINSFGFSPQLALSLSKKRGVHFNSPKQPDLVIKLLRDYGFSDTHVSEIVKKRPDLLSYNAQETIMPKLEFFTSVGIRGTALADIISGNPKFLTFSLEENLRPCYGIIRSLPILDKMAGLVLSKLYQGFTVTAPLLSNIAPNIAFLKAVQVPESSVNLYLSITLFAVSRETHKFKENVERVISMGISPSSSSFMKALYVISAVDELKWVQRMEVYKTTFSWTEDDFFLAFRKNPMFMGMSEKMVLSKIDFLVKRMGWEPALVGASPSVLTYSLEKWTIPRCSVIRVLLLKGLIMKGEYSLGGTVTTSKSYFLDRFVIRYQEQVPELLNIFQGKMSLADVGLGFEETGETT
ncbi:hypothetical protein ACLB2K_066892 [Fragaria x ananassa]